MGQYLLRIIQNYQPIISLTFFWMRRRMRMFIVLDHRRRYRRRRVLGLSSELQHRRGRGRGRGRRDISLLLSLSLSLLVSLVQDAWFAAEKNRHAEKSEDQQPPLHFRLPTSVLHTAQDRWISTDLHIEKCFNVYMFNIQYSMFQCFNVSMFQCFNVSILNVSMLNVWCLMFDMFQCDRIMKS